MRWSGPFPTPNMAGMELASTTLVLFVSLLYIFRSKTKNKQHLGWSVCLLASGSFAALVATGSRAGYLALLVGLGVTVVMRLISIRHYLSLIIPALCVAGLLSPFNDRFLISQADQSILARISLWKSSLALIDDHVLIGIGSRDLLPVLDRWYLPVEFQGRFATALNESLTAIGSWGIITYGALVFLISVGIISGIQKARLGSYSSACSSVVLVTHIVCGQFQGHVFSGYLPVACVWIASLVATLYFARSCITPRVVALGMASSLVLCGVILVLASSIGNSNWATKRIGGEIIGVPRNAHPKFLVIAVGSAEGPKRQVSQWLNSAREKSLSVVFPDADDLLRTTWWHSIESYALSEHISVIAIGSGEQGAILWDLWRVGKTGSARVWIGDPHCVPKGKFLGGSPGSLNVCASPGAAFVDREGISALLASEGRGKNMTTMRENALWWLLDTDAWIWLPLGGEE